MYALLLERPDLCLRFRDFAKNSKYSYQRSFPQVRSNFNHASIDTYTYIRNLKHETIQQMIKWISDKKYFAELIVEEGWPHPKMIEHADVKKLGERCVFVKPRNDAYGTDCFPVKGCDFDAEKYVAEYFIAQELMENSREMKEMFPGPLTTIRVWTGKMDNRSIGIVDAVINTPKHPNICSNTVQGNYVIGLELEDGTMGLGSTFIVRAKNRGYLPPPNIHKFDNCKPFHGKKFPKWSEIKDLAIKVHEKFKDYFPFIACDYCVSDKGVYLLEANLMCSMDVFENCLQMTQSDINAILMNHVKERFTLKAMQRKA